MVAPFLTTRCWIKLALCERGVAWTSSLFCALCRHLLPVTVMSLPSDAMLDVVAGDAPNVMALRGGGVSSAIGRGPL